MSTEPTPQSSNDHAKSPAVELPANMFDQLFPPVDPADIERFKAEHAARMKESAKNWPGRKRSKRRGR